MNQENPEFSEMSINQVETLDRRTLFMRAGAIAAVGGVALAAGKATAQDESNQSWEVNAALIDSALDCVKESEACIAHCVSTFREGSVMLAECSGLVLETIAACTALAKIGSYGSTHLKDLARVVMASCQDCEKECRLHASHHEECKACADSCVACIKECEKLLA